MSKFNKKKKGDLPAVNTASLPDIVFMLLFFFMAVSYTHLRAHETEADLVCRLLLEKKKK